MHVDAVTPILNVTDLQQSFAWFEKLGWSKAWEYGDPPEFGAVRSGQCEIFLCQGCQGGRGKGANTTTFGRNGEAARDQGVWLTIWVDGVDEIHQHCIDRGLDVTWPPTDMPWGVRELHVRHPDGHVFRLSQGIPHEHDHDHPHVHEHER